jgi:hypothetical protein
MKCKLCDEKFDTRYRIPRNLTCGHCFCEQCLKIYENDSAINCPRCGKSSPVKVPICYALYELIDNDNESKKTDYCGLHPMEKALYNCTTCDKSVCSHCFISTHIGHDIVSIKDKSIQNEVKKDYLYLYESLKAKYNMLKDYKNELEKSELFLDNMLEEQRNRLNDIQNSIVTRKREKLERLNKNIEINFLTQHDCMSKYVTETELKLNYIELYIGKIEELLEYYATRSTSEIANFNICKTEDEFKKIRYEIEPIKFGPELKYMELQCDFNPRKMLTLEKINYDNNNIIPTNYLTNKKENHNAIIFFGDTKDKCVLKYNFDSEEWGFLEIGEVCQEFDLWDYSAIDAYPNGDILITGGCFYINYKNSAQKSTYIAKLIDNKVVVSQHKPMLVNRFSHGCLIIKGIPYVFGGHDGKDCLSSLEYYDDSEGKWKFLSFMNMEREIFAYCSIRDRYIYTFGGFNTNHLDSIERYDIVYDKWKVMSYRMKKPLQNSTAVPLGCDKIALIGGYSGILHSSIDILDLTTKCWTSLQSMYVARRRPHCYRYNNKVRIWIFI